MKGRANGPGIGAARTAIVLAIGTVFLGHDLGFAQDGDKELGWSFVANLAAVWTGGNSESSTYGVGATARRAWPTSELKLEAGGTQTQSSLTTRAAVGSAQNFDVRKDTRTEKTAELFYGRGRFDHEISKRFHLLGGVDWLRNTFAGIDSRTLLGLGGGNKWADDEKFRFLTDYAFTYTFQAEVVENPFTKSKFPGVRIGYDLWWDLTPTTELLSTLAADWNLDNTDDVRIDFTATLPVSINEVLELKPSLQLSWRNDPALTEVDLVDEGGAPSGEKVLVPLEELDTLFTLALVVKM